MTSKFNKNAILLGSAYSSCLVCDTYISSEVDAAKHILKEEHKANLDASRFVDEFVDDYIRKVKKGFYCELCNQCIATMDIGRVHVSENEHIRRKDTSCFECLGNDLIIYKDVAITKEAWNGIVENKCILCDIQCDDMEDHISNADHLAKMLQVEVEFRIYNGLYRMMDNSFQCLTCNEVFRLVKTSIQACVTTHFLRSKHKQIQEKLAKAAKDATDIVQLKEFGQYFNKNKSELSKDLIIKKETMEQFINNFYSIEVPFLGGTDIVINTKIVVNVFSFYFITKDTLKCMACNVKLTIDQIDSHNVTLKHETAMKETPVITLKSAEDEFIREVRPDVYHCGFCNSIEHGLDNMLEHFGTFGHRESRTSASWRLHMYLVTKNKN